MGSYFSKTTTEPPANNASQRVYGWQRDKPDIRDRHYHLTRSVPVTDEDLPTSVDLREQCPPVYDQGKLGSCTANAVAGAFQFDELKQRVGDPFLPARLFIYYNERQDDGDVGTDAGSSLRESMKAVNKYGTCHEKYWPYIIEKFTEKPSEEAYQDGLKHKGLKYERLRQDLVHLKHCLAGGFPFVFGFLVFSSFESEEVKETGQMPMPTEDEEVLGGHAVMAVGYNDEQKCFIVRNSWGAEWGAEGYFYMPYEFITHPKLVEDFWSLEFISAEPEQN